MKVGVLGGGLQGSSVALELASRGVFVDLYEREAEVMTRASLHNEGKLHLGFVYAKDESLRTAALMAQGAASFAPLLSRWTGVTMDGAVRSSPFNYLVHRDSLLSPDELEARYAAVTDLCREAFGGHPGAYLGLDPTRPVERLSKSEFEATYNPDHGAGAFRTPELAVDPEVVARAVREAVAAEPRIRVVGETTVLAVHSDPDRPEVEFDGATEGKGRARYDHVVNALWSDRLAIDQTAGIPLVRPWSFRMKRYLRVRDGVNLDLPSTTIVLGPFGDVVRYASGELFLSWYPVGRTGWSEALVPPDWPLEPDDPMQLREAITSALATLVPGLVDLSPSAVASADVGGGVIYALGDTDVQDRASLFHQRWRTGPMSYGRYHTVDTGKYTTVPLFALRLADHLMGETP